MVPSKQIKLRYPAVCSVCRADLAPKSEAWWDATARSATCDTCHDQGEPIEPSVSTAPPATVVSAPEAPRYAFGVAGGSAQLEFERRHQRREERIDQRWGRLAGVVKFLSDDPQNITAWAKGSDGERRLAARLTREIGDRTILLNDRKVPKTRGNIDHIAIAASGVWVIDAKNYKGRVESRDVGGWFKTDVRLFVGGRDRTKLVTGLGWQIAAVRTALDEIDTPIVGVVCFTDGEWGLFPKPFSVGGVRVTWAQKLVEMISAPGPLTAEVVASTAERLSSALPPEIPHNQKLGQRD